MVLVDSAIARAIRQMAKTAAGAPKERETGHSLASCAKAGNME